MTPSTGNQIITTHIKNNQTMQFGQLLIYNIKNIFP